METAETPLVFVVGDPIIDRYIEGEVTHIAPDAPVPVFREKKYYDKLGGMWNAACNVKGAGAEPVIFNVLGVSESDVLQLQGEAFDPEHTCSLFAENWVTQRKIRYLGQYAQQVFRSDIAKNTPIDDDRAAKIASIARRSWLGYERASSPTFLICDYACGVVGPTLVKNIRAKFPSSQIIVDPYPSTPGGWYEGADYLKMNTKEYELLDEREYRVTGRHLIDFVSTLIVTDGGDNITVYRRASDSICIKPPRRDLVDPCGAGDAFVAYLVVAMSLGHTLEESVTQAAHAGACAVSHKGVVAVQRNEVLRSIAAS